MLFWWARLFSCQRLRSNVNVTNIAWEDQCNNARMKLSRTLWATPVFCVAFFLPRACDSSVLCGVLGCAYTFCVFAGFAVAYGVVAVFVRERAREERLAGRQAFHLHWFPSGEATDVRFLLPLLVAGRLPCERYTTVTYGKHGRYISTHLNRRTRCLTAAVQPLRAPLQYLYHVHVVFFLLGIVLSTQPAGRGHLLQPINLLVSPFLT